MEKKLFLSAEKRKMVLKEDKYGDLFAETAIIIKKPVESTRDM